MWDQKYRGIKFLMTYLKSIVTILSELHNFQQTTAADKTDSTLERGCATTRQSIICRCLKR